jgi:hypothetical protein
MVTVASPLQNMDRILEASGAGNPEPDAACSRAERSWGSSRQTASCNGFTGRPTDTHATGLNHRAGAPTSRRREFHGAAACVHRTGRTSHWLVAGGRYGYYSTPSIQWPRGHGARARGIADRVAGSQAPRSAAGIRLSRQLAAHASAPRPPRQEGPRAWGARLPSRTGMDRLGMWGRGVRRRARAREPGRGAGTRAGAGHVPRPVGRRLFDPLDGTTGAAAGRHLGPAGDGRGVRGGWGYQVDGPAGGSGTIVPKWLLASVAAGGSRSIR